ncbi:MAG: hypothetical protein WCK11_05475 [Candidatus Falkowbacteria bacterium]
MDIVTVASSTFTLTDKALNLINFFSQLFTLLSAVNFGLIAILIVILIYK